MVIDKIKPRYEQKKEKQSKEIRRMEEGYIKRYEDMRGYTIN